MPMEYFEDENELENIDVNINLSKPKINNMATTGIINGRLKATAAWLS